MSIVVSELLLTGIGSLILMFQLISQDDLEFAQSMEFASFWFLYNLQAIQKHPVKSRNYQMNHFLVAL